MDRELARQEIRRNWRRIIPSLLDTAKRKVNRETSYICPCGHGAHGDGLTVNPKSSDGCGLKCFGCGWSGDIISLYQKLSGADYNSALSVLGQEIGITVEETGFRREARGVRREGAGDRKEERGYRGRETGRRGQDEGSRIEERGQRRQEAGSRIEEKGQRRQDVGSRIEERGRRGQDVGSRIEERGQRRQNVGPRNKPTTSLLTPSTSSLAPPASARTPHSSSSSDAQNKATKGSKTAFCQQDDTEPPPAAKRPPEAQEIPENATVDFSQYYKECHARLTDPEALAYITRRGISLETASAYMLGFDPQADPANNPGGGGDFHAPVPATDHPDVRQPLRGPPDRWRTKICKNKSQGCIPWDLQYERAVLVGMR